MKDPDPELQGRSPESKRQFEAKALTPEIAHTLSETLNAPLEGIYVEIGPSMNPYLAPRFGWGPNSVSVRKFDTERAAYVGVDGGRSGYNRQRPAAGWGELQEGKGQPALRNLAGVHEDSNAATHFKEVEENIRGQGNPNAHIRIADAREDNFAEGSVKEIYASDVLLTPGVDETSTLEIASAARKALQEDSLFIIRENYVPRGGKENLTALLKQAGFAEVYAIVPGQTQDYGLGQAINRNFGYDMQTSFIARGIRAPQITS